MDTKFQFEGLSVKSGQEGAKIGSIQYKPHLFSELPINPPMYLTALITDSNTHTLGATIAGSGSFCIVGIFNGTNWKVQTSGTTIATP